MPVPAKIIKALRERSTLTVEELANKAGISRQAIHSIEQGKRQPSLATAKAICKGLGASLAVFDA